MSDYIVEKAMLCDCQELYPLIESAYRGDAARVGWTHEADLLDGERLPAGSLENTLADKNNQILVARNKTTRAIDGTICITRDGNRAEFGKFAVKPNIQGGGIGKLLMNAAEEFAKSVWNSEFMLLSVITLRTELIEFYKRRGYQPTGKFIGMQDVHSGDNWRKGRDLVLEIYQKLL